MDRGMENGMVPGTEVQLGRHRYVVPPAPFACVEKYEDVFMGRNAEPSPTVIFDILYMSIKRNYPELKREDLANDVDIANMNAAFSVAMAVNAQGVDSGEGETPAAM